MKIRTLAAAFLLAALCLLLPGCGGGDDMEMYTLGDIEIPALPTDEEPRMDMYGMADAYVRTYTEFTEVETILPDYVNLLTSEEYGFQIVTKALKTCAPPVEYGPEGDIYLGYPAGEEGEKTLLLEIVWDPESCEVVSSIIPGPITEGSTSNRVQYHDARDYMLGLSPSVLGLSGGSMSAYEVFSYDGGILVNGSPCMRFDVYEGEATPKEGNDFQGAYLLSQDGQHLYRLNLDTNEVEVLDAPAFIPSGDGEDAGGEDGEQEEDDGKEQKDKEE